MRESDVDELFLRFRRDGDPGHLARVFDATAPELLRIARHVAANPQEAEDLLQATFLTALEKGGRFQEGRRVRQWLVGILVRHAHAARRRGRRRVLEQAAAGSPAPLPSVALTSLGGLLVVNKILIGVVAVALLVLATTLLFPDGDGAEVVDASETSPDVAAAGPRAGSSPAVERAEARPASESPATDVAPAPAGAGPAPAEETGAFTGRLLLDGAPLPDVEVTLLRVRVEDLTGSLLPVLLRRTTSPVDEIGRAISGADGRFSIGGAPACGVLALGVDLGGPRATARVVDVALAPDATGDVGDVELGPVTALRGRVVDEDGAPVPGATVSAVVSPVPLALVGAERFRPDAVVVEEDDRVSDLPPWVAAWWDRLPVPTATTGTDGRFTLEGAPRGVVNLVVRKDGRVPVATPVPTGRAPVRDVGERTLATGRTLRGTVLGADGAPVGGAEVFAGVAAPLGGPT